jgi:lipopolysaccharide transport system ATP-binding protein
MSDIVVRIEDLSKEYRLGVLGHGALYKDVQSWIAKFRGKEDPNSKVNSYQLNKPLVNKNDRFWALQDISFDVKQGEVVGIIGRNGAGKSTLLKILSRVTAPTKGTIKLKGRISSLLEVGTGFHPELTGRENIYLNGAIMGMTKKEISQKFDEIVAFAEVEKFIDTPVKRYSSGMYVRLAFAVAAHLDPEILIVDEVLAVGDLNFRKKCLGKMKEISSSSGRTVLFVSHDMSAIQSICSSGILLQKGRLIYSGTAEETVKAYLQNGEGFNNRMEWYPQKAIYPFNDVIKIKHFYLEDSSKEIPAGRLFNSKSYQAVIEADLLYSDPRLIFVVAFYDEHERILFSTDIYDTGEINFGKIKPGPIKLSVPIPVDMFWNKVYGIELLCALHQTGWVLPPGNETKMGFEFFRDVDLNPYSNNSRLGLLAPKLKWEVDKLL